jgi:NTE family protein
VDEELKRIEMISRLIEEGRLQPGEGARRVRLHRLEGTAMTRDLPFSGKYNLDWQFLCGLRDFGRAMASDWLKTAPHAASVKPGQRAASRFGAQALAQGTHQ